MPTYKNNRVAAALSISSRHNARTGTVEDRRILPGEIFVARSSDFPERWLVHNPDEYPQNPLPWVTELSPEPTDEQI